MEPTALPLSKGNSATRRPGAFSSLPAGPLPPGLAEDNNNNSNHKGGLGEHWQSALCVTSLYDAYVALQHENEGLRQRNEQLQRANELLRVTRSGVKAKGTKRTMAAVHRKVLMTAVPQEEMEDVGEGDEREEGDGGEEEEEGELADVARELRLVRSEKTTQELLHERQRTELARQVTEYKRLYEEQLAKSQERLERDPMGPQRVALTTQSLQRTLEGALGEKEELGLRYQALQGAFAQLQGELAQTRGALERHLQHQTQRTRVEAAARLLGALERLRWRAQARVWMHWRSSLTLETWQARRRLEDATRERQRHEGHQRWREGQLARAMRVHRAHATRRCFDAWVRHHRARRSLTQGLGQFQHHWERRRLVGIVRAWHLHARACERIRRGMELLVVVKTRSRQRRYLRRWSRVCVDTTINGLATALNEKSTETAALEADLSSTRASLHTLCGQLDTMKREQDEDKQAHAERVDELHGRFRRCRKAIVKYFAQCTARNQINAVMKEWLRVARARHAVKVKTAKFASKRDSRSLGQVLSRWREFTTRQLKCASMAQRCLTRMRMLGVSRCFHRWSFVVSSKRERLRLMAGVLSRMQARTVEYCFRAWDAHRTTRKQSMQRMLGLLCRGVQRTMAYHLRVWIQAASAQTAAIELQKRQRLEIEWKQRMEQSKLELQFLRQWFTTWRSKIKHIRTVRQMAQRYALRWKSGVTGMCFETWKCATMFQRSRRQQLTRILQRRCVSILRVSWVIWHKCTLLRVQEEALKARTCDREKRIMELEGTIAMLHATKENARNEALDQIQRLTSSLQQAIATAEEATAERERVVASLVQYFSSCRQRRELVRVVTAWKTVSYTRQQMEHLIESFKTSSAYRKLRMIFSAWMTQSRKRSTMVAVARRLLNHGDRFTCQQCFQNWKSYWTLRIKTSAFAVAQKKRHEQQLLQQVLDAWRTNTRRLVLLRKIVGGIWTPAIRRCIRIYWACWATLVAHQRSEESARSRQVAIDSFAATLLKRWMSTSTREVFSAWHNVVVAAKSQRVGERILSNFCKRRLLVTCFGAWTSMLSRRRCQWQWLTDWHMRKQSQRRRARFFQWKAATQQHRNQELNMLRSLRIQHEEKILHCHSEASDLERRTAELLTQLNHLTQAYDSTQISQAQLCSQLTVSRMFLWWRIVIAQCRETKWRTDTILRRHSVNRLRITMHKWRTAMIQQKQRRQMACEYHRSSQLKTMLQTMRSWRTWTNVKRVQTKDVRHLQRLRTRRIYRLCINSWVDYKRQMAAAADLCNGLVNFVQTNWLRSAFLTWHRRAQFLTRLAAARAQRQKELMELMLQRDTNTIQKCLTKWKNYTVWRRPVSKRIRHFRVRQTDRTRCAVWKQWRGFIKTRRHSHSLISRIFGGLLIRSQRHAFSEWCRFAHNVTVASLRAATANLTISVHDLEVDLTAKTSEVTTLDHVIQNLKETVHKHEARLAEITCSRIQSETLAELTKRRQNSLLRIVQRSTVPVCTVSAFSCWKARSGMLSNLLKSVTRLNRLVGRRSRMHSFKHWKGQTVFANNFQRLHTQTSRRLVLQVWIVWAGVVRERHRLRFAALTRWISAISSIAARRYRQDRVAAAFRVWHQYAHLMHLHFDLNEALATSACAKVREESCKRQAILAKWMWRAYSIRWMALREAFACLRRLEGFFEPKRAAKLRSKSQPSRSWGIQPSGYQTRQDDEASSVDCVVVSQALQRLFRKLACATTLTELFLATTQTIPEILCGSSASLFLVDPTCSQLWTHQPNINGSVQAPASAGLAGVALSNCSAVFSDDITEDPRFQPMVDKFVLVGLQADIDNINVATMHNGIYDPHDMVKTKKGAQVSLFSMAIVGVDGTPYGVLQIAFLASSNEKSAVHIIGCAYCHFVEQLLHDMVRHSRDRHSTRSRERFQELFKQNKNWRKYFVQVERQARKTEEHLRAVLAEQDYLLEQKRDIQLALDDIEDQRAALAQREVQSDKDQRELVELTRACKKKIRRMKEALETKENQLAQTKTELSHVTQQFAQFRQDSQSRDLQSMIAAISANAHSKRPPLQQRSMGKDGCVTVTEDHIFRGADYATIKNQLARSESDNVLLVKAVETSTKNHGKLSDSLRAEVNRIALRVHQRHQSEGRGLV